MRRLACLGLVVMAAGARGQELWRIGEFDNSYDEFACARNHGAYAGAFPKDVTYRVGVSDPKQDWSFVNPGPADHWAGSRLHPFTIEFELPEAPRTAMRLIVDLVDVQGIVPTSMGVKVNDTEGVFRLRNGNEASIHDPAAGTEQVISLLLSPSLMRAGLNRIVLWSTGSWLVYDAIGLSAEGGADMTPKVRNVSLEPTVFFKRLPGGGLAQVVIARVEVEGPPEGLTLGVKMGGERTEVPVKAGLTFGTLEQELLVPEVTEETPIEVEAKLGETTARAEMILKPERKWRIYVAPSVHTDIGYTDLQPRVIERHNENTDRAIEYCAKYPAFGWNLEAAWQADIYRHDRTSEQCEKLYELAREGRIEIEASYLNMLTGLCSHEELNRWLYHAHALKRRYGVPFESALTSDVPTQAWSIPSTLAAAGIRYYATGINTTRGYTFNKLMTGHPYWWEGPDGSRVLAYFSPGYAHAAGPLSALEDLRSWVIATTRSRADFPYDALFMYGGFGDNQPIQENVAATAQQWADTYEYPKVIVGPNAEYFKYMEETYGDKLPTVRGDGGYYWEDGAASSARETAINRRAHETASAADALFAFAHCAGSGRPPETKLNDLWRNILLYDEHTWGAWCSISDPDAEQTTEQWRIKASFAQDADRQGWELLGQGLSRLASLVEVRGPAVIIFNPTGWDRDGGHVTLNLPRGQLPGHPRTRRPLPSVKFGESGETDQVHVLAPRVPPWGYVVCPLVPGEAKSSVTAGASSPQPILESKHYRLTFNGQTGGIKSLIDKASGRELVDRQAVQGLNEYMYVSGGDGTDIVDIGAHQRADLTIHRPAAREWQRMRFPGLWESMWFLATCEKTPSVSTIVTLREDIPVIEIHNVVQRAAERKKEAAYFAFPFAATNPEVRLEIPNGVMRPEVDQLPGACKEWYALQHFARIHSDEGDIAWASVDAPLVCVGDINRGLWPEKLEVKNGRLYSYVMNNYWFTNYKADQSDSCRFDYALTTHAGSDAEAARFGWQAAMPLHSTLIDGSQEGPLPSTPTSLCRVTPESVAITAIKAPEVGSGLVIRLFSYAEKPVAARLKLGLPGLTKATLCNLVEEPIEGLALRDGEIKVRVRPMAPTTVVVR